MVDWSENLAPGEVKPLNYFEQELVLYRPADGGPAAVLDAICPHLGAHLGYGGTVCDQDIECPFHGWRWGRDGRNTMVPANAGCQPVKNARVRSWETREIDGIVLVWYHARDEPPSWEWPGLPEFRDTERFYPIFPYGTHRYGVRETQPQSGLENMADTQHFPYVHSVVQPAAHQELTEDGAFMRARFEVPFGAGKKSTWLTPNGAVDGEIEAETWGLGLVLARSKIGEKVFTQLITHTPVDLNHTEVFSTITGTRVAGEDEPTGMTTRMYKFQHDEVEHDLVIFEHQHWLDKPLYAQQEGLPFVKVRRFARQFYPDVAATGPAAPELAATDSTAPELAATDSTAPDLAAR
jgi:phenylpropionate dioxygenase-like ring-hydroxylating dioxygenase large terminal subunit